MLSGDASAQEKNGLNSGVIRTPHVTPKVKRIVHLCMAGGPSHLETFDDKPKLKEMHDQPMPESYTKGQQIAQLQGKKLKCFGPQHAFKNFGESGQRICELFPHIGSVADDICIIRSMHTDQINHDPAHLVFNTGSSNAGRPSMGSWLLYGLGQESNDMPGYVVLTSVGRGGQSQPIAARQWQSGFLPSRFQGVQFHASGDPVLYLNRPQGVELAQQRGLIDTVNQLNQQANSFVNDPEIETRIRQYEMAFRMQTSVPQLMDLSGETQDTFDAYGTKGGDGTYASNCLLARRLLEKGVRFVQLYHRGWDHHGNIKGSMDITAKEVDQATAALIKDLKQRGLFEDTLIVFGGEFGRTPMGQGSGRDHHIKGFSMMLSGGAVQGGKSYGNTDELGYNAVEDIVHVRDFHATMLHLFGIDHNRFSYKSQGLDFRLTGVEEAHVIKDILA
ncbi:MAG: sulfatase [Blastopirellula sp.]|nr:MAG: sulfatase [Blastopirellula sp.]